MHTFVVRSCAVAALLFSLTACNKPAQDPAAVPEAVATPATTESTGHATTGASSVQAHGANSLLSAAPGDATCEAGSDIKIGWNIANKPDVTNVEVWVGEGSDAKLFASGGLSGEQQSGPWVKPGTTFILRNQSDKAELDRLTIAGEACPSAAAH